MEDEVCGGVSDCTFAATRDDVLPELFFAAGRIALQVAVSEVRFLFELFGFLLKWSRLCQEPSTKCFAGTWPSGRDTRTTKLRFRTSLPG